MSLSRSIATTEFNFATLDVDNEDRLEYYVNSRGRQKQCLYGYDFDIDM